MDSLDWRVERSCANAWPGLGQILVGDWVLRIAPGISRRANSLNPLHRNAGEIDAVLEAATPLFARLGMPVLVRVPGLIAHNVEQALASKGFTAEGHTNTLYADLSGLACQHADGADLRDTPDESWLGEMSRLQGHDARSRAAYHGVVEGIAVPAAFLRLTENDETAALTFGAITEGILCCESVITAPEHRGRGHGRRLMQALFAWAASNGATGVCLQVEADNAPGLALYRSIGLTRDLYPYHYRRAPV